MRSFFKLFMPGPGIRMCLFIALLSATNVGFGQGSEKRKVLIYPPDVSYAELVKVNFSEPEKSEKKQLTKEQYSDFAFKWNSLELQGADKYKMNYYLFIVSKDGKKRQFTIGGSKVQEQDWMTIDFGDKLYFDKLWENLK